MTQEERQLLIKDLCGRLQHGVKVDHYGVTRDLLGVITSSFPEEIVMVGYDSNDYEDSIIEDIKPYLRPMSSMTEEEMEKCRIERGRDLAGECGCESDYLNSIHIDYRGLIEKGLALEAPKDMYK